MSFYIGSRDGVKRRFLFRSKAGPRPSSESEPVQSDDPDLVSRLQRRRLRRP